MSTNPLAPNPETDIDGPEVRPPLEPDTGERERSEEERPISEDERDDSRRRATPGEEGNVGPDPAAI
jgi:hypothetical protein